MSVQGQLLNQSVAVPDYLVMRKRAAASLALLVFVVSVTVLPARLWARSTSINSAAIGNIRALVSSLEMYRAVHECYPDNWLVDMYESTEPDFGPPSFNIDIQVEPQEVQEFNYHYVPIPLGCVEKACLSYTLKAIPTAAIAKTERVSWLEKIGLVTVLGRIELRSFYADQTGVIRHCSGSVGADATDSPIDQPPVACR